MEALRADPAPLTQLDVLKVVSHYEGIIGELETRPIIMSHSLGGTIMQLLVDRGLGAAGVGVASATVKGIRDLPLSTLRASRPVLGNPFNRGKASPLNAKQFRYAFGNTMSRAESDELYERYYVPAANRMLFQIAFSNLSRKTPVKVDFQNERRAPLLFIASGEDHVVPPKATRHNAEKVHGEQLASDRRLPGVPRPPALPRRPRLGGGRGLCALVGGGQHVAERPPD